MATIQPSFANAAEFFNSLLGRPVPISLRDQNSLLILKVMDCAMLYSNLYQLYDG